MDTLKVEIGASRLVLRGAGVRDGQDWDLARGTQSSRLHFVCKGTPTALEQMQAVLENRLAEIHQSISERGPRTDGAGRGEKRRRFEESDWGRPPPKALRNGDGVVVPTSVAKSAKVEIEDEPWGEKAAAVQEYIATLPSELTEAETEMREVLLHALVSGGHSAAVRLSLVAQSPDVRRAKGDLGLPKSVGLSQWIQHRMPGDISMANSAAGENVVWVQETDEVGSTDPADDFFDSLPSDRLNSTELALRRVLVQTLKAQGGRMRLSDLSRDREVVPAKGSLLPKGMPLQVWIERRVGEEIRIHQEERGGKVAELTDLDPASRRELRSEAARDYFACLPESLTDEEETLRLALVDGANVAGFASGPVRFSLVAQQEGVRHAKARVDLPDGVSLSQWIQHRLTDDMCISKDPGSGESMLHRPGDELSADPVDFFAGLPENTLNSGERELKHKLTSLLRREGGVARLSIVSRP